MRDPHYIIERPLLTEKSTDQAAVNKYHFRVRLDANKIEIAQAITAIYAGAIDCIDLKRHRSDLSQRLELALRRRSPEFETRLRAMRSASELAGLDRGKRRILGLFASGKGQERISRELGMTETQLEGEIDEIKQRLRLPSLKDAVRMMIDYFR